MKKLLSLLVIGCLAWGLAGCGSAKSADDNSSFAGSLLSSGTIIIGSSPDYPPFESLDASGNFEGFEVDMMNSLIAIINRNEGTSLTLTWKSMEFDTIITALQAGQVDIGVSGFTYSADRDCIFATPHLSSKQVIVTRAGSGINSGADLSGKKVAAESGTTGYDAAAKIDGIILSAPSDYPTMFAALQAGQIDAVVCDEGVGDHYVSQMGFTKCGDPLIDEEMSIIVKTGNTAVAETINTALKEYLASPDYQANLEKWQLTGSAVAE